MVSASMSVCVFVCHIFVSVSPSPTFSSRPQSVRHSGVTLTQCKSLPCTADKSRLVSSLCAVLEAEARHLRATAASWSESVYGPGSGRWHFHQSSISYKMQKDTVSKKTKCIEYRGASKMFSGHWHFFWVGLRWKVQCMTHPTTQNSKFFCSLYNCTRGDKR